MNFRLLAVSAGALAAVACSPPAESPNPEWVDQLVARYEREPVGNPPQSIWRYAYQGRTVYYVPPQCCDQYSSLFDSTGVTICAPDGGFTGGGDGRCADFFTTRTKEELVWRDERPRT